jgi:hypothetical protein
VLRLDPIIRRSRVPARKIVRNDAGVSITETDRSAVRSTVYACVYVYVYVTIMSYCRLEEVNKFCAANDDFTRLSPRRAARWSNRYLHCGRIAADVSTTAVRKKKGSTQRVRRSLASSRRVCVHSRRGDAALQPRARSCPSRSAREYAKSSQCGELTQLISVS